MVTMPPTFSDDELALASSNYKALETLLSRLQAAFDMNDNLSVAELGEELGLSASDAEDLLNGQIDMTLSELAQLANALDARIDFRVNPLETGFRKKFGQERDDQSN